MAATKKVRQAKEGTGFIRVRIPVEYKEKIDAMYEGTSKNNWEPHEERDVTIFENAIKAMVDNFNIGTFSEESKNSPWFANFNGKATARAESLNVNVNTAFAYYVEKLEKIK